MTGGVTSGSSPRLLNDSTLDCAIASYGAVVDISRLSYTKVVGLQYLMKAWT